MLNTLGGGYYACHVYMLWCSLRQESLVAQFHRASRGKHRVGNDKRLAVEIWRSEIFHVYAHLRMRLVGIFAVSTDEGVSCMVEHVEKSRMERQSGAEYGSHHNVVYRYFDLCVGKWCVHRFCFILECLAHLIRHHLADTADIVAEHESVLLVFPVAYLCKILVHH